ncbi:MAG: D-alanyl-D-alanine carboxypeptidase/D-alanyl-D-alanine-endopeptidase [Lysinibacillus sp.]
MKNKIFIALLSFVMVFVTVLLPSQAQASMNLSGAVSKSLGNAGVGVSVRDSETGQILYQYYGDTARRPASNMKLLTGAAALSLLGETYRYETSVYIDGYLSNGTLNGNVYLKGSGDPTLQYSQLNTFATALKNYGIHKVNGNLYGDESIFTGEQLTPGIAKADESEYYAARTTGLVLSPNDDFDASTIIVQVKGGTPGRKPAVSVVPNAMGMTISNHATTGSRGTRNTLSITRKYGTSQVVISGSIPAGSSVREWVTVNNPTINTMYAMQQAMRERGIAFTNEPTIGRGIVPEGATRVYTVKSRTIKEMFPTFMKLSNNSMADIFVKTLGAEAYGKGDTQTGVKVLREYGQSIGLDMGSWSFEDGSGMSHKNKISPNDLTALLYHVRGMQAYQTYYQSLPVGGAKERLVGGSLRTRFTLSAHQYRVTAKTGHITGVYTLSGYVKAKSGKTYTFSIMTENRSTSAIAGIDAVVSHIINNY